MVKKKEEHLHDYCHECGILDSQWELLKYGDLVPIGETRENGVVWYDQNPHAWPKGTKFYAQVPHAESGTKTKTDA